MERLLDSVRHVESGGNVNAVSPVGAQGPYQFMPATAKEYGVTDPFDEKQARSGARKYLTNLLDQNGNNLNRALAAWNWGPGNLQKHGMEKMPLETRNFLSRVASQYASTAPANNADSMVSSLFPNSKPRQPSAPIDLFPGEEGVRRQEASSLFPNNRENDVLSASILQTKPIDEATRIYRMQLRTGLPTGLIERNLDDIEQRAKREDFDAEAFRSESPMLAEWITQNPTRASVAQGDYENLSMLEKSWSTLKAVPVGVEQGYKEEHLMMLGYKAVTGEITPQEELQRKQLKDETQLLARQHEAGFPSWVKSAAQIVGLQIPMALEATKKGVQYGIPVGAATGAAIGAAGGSAGGPLAPATVPGGALAGAATGGVIGLKAAASASYIEQTYRLSVGESFDDLESAKDVDGNSIDPVAARYASMLVAVPNALLEFASLRSAVKLVPGADRIMGRLSTGAMKKLLVRPTVMAGLKDFGKKYAAMVGTETFTEGMQKLLTIISGEIATGDLGEGFDAADLKAIADESTAAFKGTVVLGALASGPKVIELYADIHKAEQNVAFMQNLGNAAASSNTYAKAPEAFRDFVAHLKKDGPVKNVFIPIEQWDSLFQSEAPTAAAEVMGDLKQYSEAEITGGDLVIPIEAYAEKLAGTPFHEKLVPHIRLNAGEMTPTEAAEAQNAEPEIVAMLEREAVETQAKEAPLVAVYDDVYGKLRAVGMSAQESNRDALLWRERLRARAERLGMNPLELYNEKPLQIQRELPGDVAAAVATYNQQLAEPAVANPTRQPLPLEGRSEERRVGKECRSRWSPYH